MEESLIVEIWDMFRQYIPEKNKETAANQFVDFLLGKDVDTETLEGLQGFDSHLDEAINYVLEEHNSLDDEEKYIDYGDDEEY